MLSDAGDYEKGAIVEVEDERATKLIRTGYAKPAPAKKQKE
jgi:hypothetical protein